MGSIGRGATPVPCLLVLHVCSACEVLQAVQQHLMDGWQAGRALTTPQKGAWGRHPESPRLPRACGAQASWRMRPLRQPRPWLPKRLPAARPWPRSAPGRNRLERVRRGGGGARCAPARSHLRVVHRGNAGLLHPHQLLGLEGGAKLAAQLRAGGGGGEEVRGARQAAQLPAAGARAPPRSPPRSPGW